VFIFSIFIANQLITGIVSTGTFVFLFTNVFVFSGALGRLSQNLGHLYADSHFIDEVREFFELKPNITFTAVSNFAKTQLIKKIKNPTVVFENVSFAYPNSDKNVLQKINLKIPYGQNLALIGENGAGKTTLVKLLLRMYDPTEGKILINGIDLKELPEDVLFSLFSTLFQSFGKFYLTVKENLELAAGRKLNDEEMESFLKFSNAWEFVKTSKDRFNQQLGPEYKDGTDLSGGQWQRLAIARAYAKDAPMLILDEPTSAVDAKSEMEIFDRLNKEMKVNTLIFISHRFSTIKDAERIVVLHQGKVVEDGTHPQLMENKGKYFDLYTIQAERYKRA
jgi:ATP-binding cassette subfamily B protein